MALKIPIAAIGFAAVPETTGPAGIVWRESDPVLLAASMDRIIRDPVLREKLGQLGWRRYQELFTNEQIRRRFLAALEEFSLLGPQPGRHHWLG
jgi:glycosyltransferase involved in cell wall biosynthesis